MELLGFTIKALGELMVGYTAIKVHHRFREEKKIDKKVFYVMKKETRIGIIGIIFIITGWALHMFYHLFI